MYNDKKKSAFNDSPAYYFERMQWAHIGFVHSPGFGTGVPPNLEDTWHTLEERMSVDQPPEQQRKWRYS